MSELKAINAYQLTTNTEDSDVYIHNDEFGCGGDLVECYLKSEADAFVAELQEKHKTEVKKLLCLIRDKENNFNRAFDSEESHHKYKRCLDNAWWCRKLSNAYTWDACTHRGWKIAGYYDKKTEFYRKWRGRWIKIAEKFKEANQTAGGNMPISPRRRSDGPL